MEDSNNEKRELVKVENAGLCLLVAWFPRLFQMLDYLNVDKRDFKDEAFKIRAVFLLQYLVYGEEREYKEAELKFNCLLTGLPLDVLMPYKLALTDKEKQTVDSLLEGVKRNWSKMKNTSNQVFRECFIARKGRLEQKDDKWTLTVDEKAYDILLDSVPWPFVMIRLPWIEGIVHVNWRNR